MEHNKPLMDLTNEEYHGESDHFSSSQLKDALSDIEYFYKVYISKELKKNKPTSSNMDIGTWIHTAVLEPHKFESECSIYSGRRAGKEWDSFKDAHPGAVILNEAEAEKALMAINAIKADNIAMDLIEMCQTEVSAFTKLGKLPVKARADGIHFGHDGYILDVKSTSSNAKSESDIRGAIESLNYDLSAVLYLDVFSQCFGTQRIKDFYWIFASTTMGNCQVYKADQRMLNVGRAKLNKALAQIEKYEALGWEFKPEIKMIGPSPWTQDQWLDKDLVVTEKKITTRKKKVITADEDLL
jgi:hypothetical protein